MTNGSLITLVSNIDKITPIFPSDYLDVWSPRDAINSRLVGYPSTDPLTISRNIEDCQGYVYQGSPFPGTDLLINANPSLNGIPPNTQLDGVLIVPPDSLAIGICCSSIQPEGFDYRIFDKSLQKDWFYGEFVSNYMLGQFNTNPSEIPSGTNDTELDQQIVGQFLFQSPVPLIGSGELNISIVNRSANYNMAQLFIFFAVPGSYTNVQINAIDLVTIESMN